MNEFMYLFMDKHKVLVIIFAALASWEFMVAVNTFQRFKRFSGYCALAKLSAK